MTYYRTPLPSGRRPFLPAAVSYDGRTKDTLLDEYGGHRSIHPNDQGMAMSLVVERGSCKGSPEMGHDLRTIQDLKSPSLAEDVRSVVMRAEPLARLVAAGKVRVDRIEQGADRGSLGVIVYYTNLDTGERGTTDWYS